MKATHHNISLFNVNFDNVQHLITRLVKNVTRATAREIANKQRKRYQNKQDYLRLSQLPDYILRDVGVTRSQINQRLNKPTW